jgi:hypothetical protein
MMTMTGDDIRVQSGMTMTVAPAAPVTNAVVSNQTMIGAVLRAAATVMTTDAHPAEAGAGLVTRKGIAKRRARAPAMMMTTTTAVGRAVAMITMAVPAAAAGPGTPKAMRKLHDAVGKSADPRGRAVAPTMTMTTVAGRGLETTKATAVGLAIPEDMRKLPVADGKNGLQARGVARMTMTIIAGRGRVTTTKVRADGLAIRADMQKPHGAVGRIVIADP